jgi:N-acetylneuraminate synthase
MSTLGDVERALGVLAFGHSRATDKPARAAFERAYNRAMLEGSLTGRVAILHCTTQYPAPDEDMNLRAMDTLRDAFGLRVGLSDHSTGIAISLAAAARGASIIEKHFTLDRNLPGPDHAASVTPDELKTLASSVRRIERALGTGRKIVAASERENVAVARRSLVAARPIRRGEQFTDDNLAVKRPGGGISPMSYWDWLGRTAARDYRKDELIDP